ncbi:MAG: monovalent cation/H(+) antiporter subunit G [Candidatus Cyclobacteriaceae bacterium M3_2C_046]
MNIIEIISAIFILSGTLFMLISSIGLIRLPDFYIRNSASTKAIALGIALILLGLIFYYNETEIFMELGAIFFFIFLIAPLSAHIISRAAVKTNVPFWEETNLEEFKSYTKKDEADQKQDNPKDQQTNQEDNKFN